MNEIKLKVHSLQSMGTLDGPGVRFVVFVSGCPLRCGCCHNPDTWDMAQGTAQSVEDLANKAERYKEYFGNQGGVTLSGGEPLMQAKQAKAFFDFCHEKGMHICACLFCISCIRLSPTTPS